MDWKVLLVLLGTNILYLLLGGLVFNELEKEEEDDTRTLTRDRTGNFLATHQCVTTEELETLIQTIISAYDHGIIAADNATSESHWNFPSSVFFSGTVVTTIGYGHISPSTAGGRVFCVFYAIFGIPLMLVLLAAIGEKLRLLAEKFDPEPKFCQGRPKLAKGLRLGFLLTVGLILFLFVPGVIFMEVEDWTYGESLYYGVITLTTVGFGDFVPGAGAQDSDVRALYRICIWCWIFIGLAWLATVLSGLQEFVQELTSKMERKVTKKSSKRADDYGAHSTEDEVNGVGEVKTNGTNNQEETLGEFDLKNRTQPNGKDQATEVTVA